MRSSVVLLLILSVLVFPEIIKSDDIAIWASSHSKESFSFVVFGDSRPVAWMGPIPKAFLERVFKEISWIRPDFIIHLGDIIYGFHEPSSRIDKEYEEFIKVYEENAGDVPLLLIPANHELQPSDHSFEKFKELFGNLLYYDFTFGRAHFIVLNTNFPSSMGGGKGRYALINANDGHHEKAMMDWFCEVLEKPASLRFLITHVPKFSIEGEKPYQNANEDFMKKILVKVDAYFAAHRHFLYESEKDGTKLFILGSGGAPLDRLPYACGPQGTFAYMLVEVQGERVSYKTLVPFSIDVTQEENQIIVSNFSPYDLTLRGVDVPSMSVKAFLVREKMKIPIPVRVKVEEAGGRCYVTIELPRRSYVILKSPND